MEDGGGIEELYIVERGSGNMHGARTRVNHSTDSGNGTVELFGGRSQYDSHPTAQSSGKRRIIAAMEAGIHGDTVVLSNSTVTGNDADNGNGGGISSHDDIAVANSIVAGNSRLLE